MDRDATPGRLGGKTVLITGAGSGRPSDDEPLREKIAPTALFICSDEAPPRERRGDRRSMAA